MIQVQLALQQHLMTVSIYSTLDSESAFIVSRANRPSDITTRHQKHFKSEKYGIDLPCFTHASSTILYASTKVDNSIKYHSLHDNTYLQYFRGHNGKVNSLEMSPVSDQFLSASSDDTVRLWDIRSPQCMVSFYNPTF